MFTRFFGNNKSNAKSQTPKTRKLRMEHLENRELLSVTPTEYAEIRELYSAFELSENMAEVNVIDLTAATTSAELQAALDAAKSTPQDDLIVLRTTAEASSARFDRTITVDFDENISGKLTIVSYGSALAQVSSAENAVFSVEAGDARLGGFAFVGKENGATGAFDLTPVADGATLAVERSIYLKQSGGVGDAFEGGNGQNQEPNNNATGGTDNGTSGTGIAAFEDARFTADFQVDGSTWGYVAGLTLSEAVELTTASYYYQTDRFFDADKTWENVDDDELCWAATASNMLKYVGFDAGMTVDEIFQEFQYCFPDVAGWVNYGIAWFLTGEFAPSSWENGVQIENPGGAHYPNVTVSDYLGSYNVDSRNADDAVGAMRVGTNALHFGAAAGLGIGWYAPSDASYSQRNGGHAATLWGYYYDATKSADDPEYYTDLIISCSDDYTGSDRRYATPLDFDATQNLYVMKDYNADGVENSSYGLLETIFVLAPDDSGDLLIPDLTAQWKPEGWGDVLTLSSTRGNTSDNATNFEVGDTIYFSAAVSNVGAGAADAFEVKFELTNAAGETVDAADYWTFSDGLGANYYSWWHGNSNWAYSGLKIGEYTLTMTIDHRGAVAEINEANNVYVKTFTVSGETPSLVVTTNEDATNATDGEISLREAIAYANAYPELGGTITFDPSLKGQTIALNGTEIALSKAVTIDASALYDAKNDAPGLTLDAGGLSRVFYITGGTAENPVELNGLKIANGSALHGGGVMVYANSALSAQNCVFVDNKTTNTGGGGLCVDGWADLENCVFSGNSAATDGGGFYVAVNASLTATDVTISGNSAKFGGGLLVVGTATLSDSTIYDNAATNRGGGARINPTGTATFIDSTIYSNSANYGGGISSSGTLTTIETTFIENSATTSGGGLYADGTTTLTDTTTSGNTATYGGGVYANGTLTATGATVGNNEATYGGGVYVNDAVTATFTDCAIGGNASSSGGGATYIDNDALATFTNCEIIDNTASHGGAAYVDASQATFTDCTISDNSATNNGGGVYVNDAATATFTDCAIVGNSAVWGGGLQTWGTAEIVNSAIVGNTSTSGGGGLYLAGTTTITNATIAGNNAGWGGGFQVHPDVSATLYNSIVELNTASNNAQIAKNGTLTAYNVLSSYTSWDAGSSNYAYNPSSPLFTDAANGDYTLAANSQALDKGNNSYISGYATDLAGKTRVSGTYVDLGAYEYQQTTPLSTPSLSVSATSSSSLSVKIGSVANAASYTLEYSTSSSFTSKTTKTYSGSGTYTLTGLSANTTYYVRVKAVGTGAYSDSSWSSVKNATTPNPETPSLVVTSNLDVVDETDGVITLREAIQYAQADSSLGSTITFAASMKGKTITLSGTQLTISKALTIDASALYDAAECNPGITIDADGLSRVFYVNAGTASAPVELIALAMENGYENFGGAIYVASSAALSIAKCDVMSNDAASAGGGIYSEGVLDVADLCWIYGNSAPYGGGVYSSGSLVLTDAHVFSNSGTWGGGVYSIGTLTSTSSFYNGNDAALGGGGVHVARGKTATFSDDSFMDNVGGSYGGGLNVDGAVSVENCTFESNQAEYGGGVHVDEVDGDLTLIGSSVSENTATYGGGICADGKTGIENTYIAFNIATNGGGLTARTTGTTTVKNSEFHANEATDGGGIYVDTNAGLILEDSEIRGNYANSTEGGGGGVAVKGTATISDSYLYGNTAAWGGGLHVVGTATAENVEIFGNTATWSAGIDVDYAGNLTLKDSAVSGNSATNSGGGLSVNGAATITGTTIDDNEASEQGGGLWCAGSTTLSNCVIADNSARWGAGAVVWGEFAMTNSLATGNVATSGGGGIYIGETSPATITNSTIAGNEAGWGGGLQVADNCDVSLYNTILAQNTQNASTDDVADVIDSGATLNAYNTLSSYSAWDAGANNLVYDASKPLFTDAANGDYTLAANSQAIDKGNNSYISGYSTDLAGKTRVVGGTVDLGAYERQSVVRPDLIPYAPNGWSAPVVLASFAGATVDSATIASNDTVYVSFAVANAGEGVATGPFEMTLKLKDASGNVLKTLGPFADFDLEALSYVDALGNDADWNFGKLAPGTYTVTYTVDSGADVAESNESNNVYSKTFTVSAALPAAPTNVKFGAYDASTKKATLTWIDNATNEARYEIQCSTNGGSWTALSNLAANATSRVCSGLEPGNTYQYRVRAVASNGTASDWVVATITPTAAPTNVKFGPYDAATKKATLTWTDNATNEVRYEIQSSTNGGASWNSLPNLAANTTSRVCSGLQVGTTYAYRVRAVAADGTASDWVSASITPTEATVVAAPTNVKFGAYDASTKKATLTWTDNATNEVRYEIQSSTNGGAWKSLANLAANATSRVCGGLEIGNVYQYRVRAVAADGTASDWVSASITPVVAPAAPTNVKFGAYDSANKRATLTWTDNATNEVRYEIQSSTNGGASWNSLSNLAANTTSRVCSGLQVGTTYMYRVRAVAADGTASDWVVASITPTVAVAAPTNVKFGAYDASAKKATLTWTDNATSEVRYEIQSSVNGAAWKSLSNLAANTTSRVCAGLEPGSTYQYRIRAVDSAGNASAWVSATIAPPAAPTNVKFGAYDATNKRATLTWTDNATNEVRYEIQSSTNGGEWKSLSNLAANTTSRVCSGLQAGTTYSYRIRAVNADGVASNWVSATLVTTVKLTAPTSLTMVGYNSTTKRATLAWVDMEAKETGYEVQSSTNGGAWQNLPTLAANTSARACAGLELGNVYKYRVRAICDGGFSDWVEITFDASGKLDAPTGLTMIGYNPTIGKATLAWVDNASGETKYEVQSSTNGGKSWNKLQDLGANSVSRSCAGLTAGQTFIYRIRAVSDAKVSDWASIMFYAPPASSSAVLASEVFANPFDESDFFADEDEFDAWARVRS